MATNDPVGTVRRMFAAFRLGDIDAVLETVDAVTHWTYVGANPKLAKTELVGKARVRRFFEAIVRRVEMTTFEANEFVVEGDTVVVFGGESGRVRATGEAFRNDPVGSRTAWFLDGQGPFAKTLEACGTIADRFGPYLNSACAAYFE